MKDLLQLYSIESVHPNEQEISDFICQKLMDADVYFEESEYGIVGHTPEYENHSGLKILLSAHMDQVKTNGAAKHFYMKDGCIRGYLDNNQQTSLGADDKNGVWLILKMIEDKKPISFIISRGEECGGVGIKRLEIPEADICLVLDRRGYKEILNKGGSTPYCSTLAQALCNFLGNDWRTGTGSFSDTQTICQKMESVNMSVAYYRPHSAEEYTNWSELCDMRSQLCYIADSFKHYPTDPSVYCLGSGNYYGGYNERDLFGIRYK